MGWTEERIESLGTMWAAGMSASQIARNLGGVSRSAVIGKVHRMGIAARQAPSGPRRVADAKAKQVRRVNGGGQTRKNPLSERRLRPVVLAFEETTPTATILNLSEHSCRWPIGDPAASEFGFCGRRRAGRGSYCQFHAEASFRQRTAQNLSAEIRRAELRCIAGGAATDARGLRPPPHS
jgi:GcrA cell cycle regulator